MKFFQLVSPTKEGGKWLLVVVLPIVALVLVSSLVKAPKQRFSGRANIRSIGASSARVSVSDEHYYAVARI